jgi:AcrR family transcriptional regulator
VSSEAPTAGSGTPEVRQTGDTRERILDVALELFTTQGYDKTSLREIAERMEFSKAAIYYHFASKEDILMALHMRLHAFGREELSNIDSGARTPQQWTEFLYRLIDQMLAHRELFVFHERNRAALEQLHNTRHDDEHEDLEAQFRSTLTDRAIALEDRVRMACAFGASFGGLVLVGNAFADVSSDVLGAQLRAAVSALMNPTD